MCSKICLGSYSVSFDLFDAAPPDFSICGVKFSFLWEVVYLKFLLRLYSACLLGRASPHVSQHTELWCI